MQTVHSLMPVPKSDRCEPLAIAVSCSKSETCNLQFVDLRQRLNWLHNEHDMLWMMSEQRLDVPTTKVLADTHQNEAVARLNFVSIFGKKS